MIFVFIWILVFSSFTWTTARSVVLGLGALMLLLLPSELIPVCWAYIWAENEYLNYCHKCFLLFLMGIWDVVFFFRDIVHCKLYSLNSSNRRTTLFTWTDWNWENLSSSSHIFCNIIPLWDPTDNLCVDVHLIFLLLFLLLFCAFERCNYFGASAGCLHWKSEK